MIRTGSKEIGNSEINEKDPIWQEIRDELYLWAMASWRDIYKIYKNFNDCSEIAQRYRELWKPILTTAKYVGDKVFADISSLALGKIKEAVEEDIYETRQMLLLHALLRLVTEERFYSISEVKQAVEDFLEEGEDKKWLTNHWIGRTLSKSFKLSKRKREAKRALRWMTPAIVAELAKRYGISPEEEKKTVESFGDQIFELYKQGMSWEDIYEKLKSTGYGTREDDAEKLFVWLSRLEKHKDFAFFVKCNLESEERNKNGRRLCAISPVDHCAVVDPAKCPIRIRWEKKIKEAGEEAG